ncbi:MAG: hypothetical protein PVF97_06865, partial [Desulfobacterales bacterium]
AASSSLDPPGEIIQDQTTQSDLTDAPSTSASTLDAADALVDRQDQALPASVEAKPLAGETVLQDTESDPSAIIDFVIRKRSRQQSDQ